MSIVPYFHHHSLKGDVLMEFLCEVSYKRYFISIPCSCSQIGHKFVYTFVYYTMYNIQCIIYIMNAKHSFTTHRPAVWCFNSLKKRIASCWPIQNCKRKLYLKFEIAKAWNQLLLMSRLGNKALVSQTAKLNQVSNWEHNTHIKIIY